MGILEYIVVGLSGAIVLVNIWRIVRRNKV